MSNTQQNNIQNETEQIKKEIDLRKTKVVRINLKMGLCTSEEYE